MGFMDLATQRYSVRTFSGEQEGDEYDRPAYVRERYADADGLEVDAVIELRDGRWAGIEIKLGENKVEEAAHSLNRLRKKVAANPTARNPSPTFMAVLLGKGDFARYLDAEDVYVIPIDCLGA